MATALRANRIVPSFESLQFPGQPAEPAPYRIRPNQQPREPSKQASDSRDPAGKTHSLEREGDQFPSFDPTSGFRFCRKARIPGSQEFVPSYKTESHWSDRRKEIDRLLFPGYVFCRLDPANRLPVLKAPGVVDLVGFGKVPAPLADQEIEAIRRMVQSGLLVMPWPFLERGHRVLIEHGPLAGVEGILDEVKGKCRLVVSVNLLQRSVSAEIDRS